MGLVGAFHPALETRKVVMLTRVCGMPSRITYDCTHEDIPTWVREDISEDCRGMRITFYISLKSIALVRRTLLKPS